MAEIFKNNIGTIFEATVTDENGNVIDISAATVLKLNFKSPSGVFVSRTAILSSGGTNGKMRYTSLAGDIGETGTWTIQGYVEQGAGTKFHTSYGSFDVISFLA